VTIEIVHRHVSDDIVPLILTFRKDLPIQKKLGGHLVHQAPNSSESIKFQTFQFHDDIGLKIISILINIFMHVI